MVDLRLLLLLVRLLLLLLLRVVEEIAAAAVVVVSRCCGRNFTIPASSPRSFTRGVGGQKVAGHGRHGRGNLSLQMPLTRKRHHCCTHTL
jgi:hypothetical protein